MSFGNYDYSFHNKTTFYNNKNLELNKNGKVKDGSVEIASSSLKVNDDCSVSEEVKALNELLAEIWGSDNDITESQFKELLNKLKTVCNERINFNIDTVPESNQYMLQEDEQRKTLRFTYNNGGEQDITALIELVISQEQYTKTDFDNAKALLGDDLFKFLKTDKFIEPIKYSIDFAAIEKAFGKETADYIKAASDKNECLERFTEILSTGINFIVRDLQKLLAGTQNEVTADSIFSKLNNYKCQNCNVQLDKYNDLDLTYIKISFKYMGTKYKIELPQDVTVYNSKEIPNEYWTDINGEEFFVNVDSDKFSEIFDTVVEDSNGNKYFYTLKDECKETLRKQGFSDADINNMNVKDILVKLNLVTVKESRVENMVTSMQKNLNDGSWSSYSDVTTLLDLSGCTDYNVELTRDNTNHITGIKATFQYRGKSCSINLNKNMDIYSSTVFTGQNSSLLKYFDSVAEKGGNALFYTLNEEGLNKIAELNIDKSNIGKIIEALGGTVDEEPSKSGILNNTIKTLQNLLDSGASYRDIVQNNSIYGKYISASPIKENGQLVGVKITGLQLDGESYTIEIRKGALLIDGNDIEDTTGKTESGNEYTVNMDSLINKYFTAAVTNNGDGIYYYLNSEGLAKLNAKDNVDEHSPITDILEALASGLTDTDLDILNFCSNPDASIEDLVDLKNNNSDINYVVSNMSGSEATIKITNKASGYSQDWKITMTEENIAQFSAVYMQSAFDTLQALLNSGDSYRDIVQNSAIYGKYTSANPVKDENGNLVGVKITGLKFFANGPSYTLNLTKDTVYIDNSDINAMVYHKVDTTPEALAVILGGNSNQYENSDIYIVGNYVILDNIDSDGNHIYSSYSIESCIENIRTSKKQPSGTSELMYVLKDAKNKQTQTGSLEINEPITQMPGISEEEKEIIINRYFNVSVTSDGTPVTYSLNSDAISELQNHDPIVDYSTPLDSKKIKAIIEALNEVIAPIEIEIIQFCKELENGSKGPNDINAFLSANPGVEFNIERSGDYYNIKLSNTATKFTQTVQVKVTEENQKGFDNLCFLQTINNLQKLVNNTEASYRDIVQNDSVYGKYTSASPVKDENGNLTGVSFKGLEINGKEYDITFTRGQEIFLKDDILSAAGDLSSRILDYFNEAGGVHDSNETLFYTLNEKGISLLGGKIPTGGITAIVEDLVEKIQSSITAINKFISDETRGDYVQNGKLVESDNEAYNTKAEETLAKLGITPDSVSMTYSYIEYTTDEGVVHIDLGNFDNNLIIDANYIPSSINSYLLNKYFTPVVSVTQDGERKVLYYVLDSKVLNNKDIMNKLKTIENVNTALESGNINIDKATVESLCSSIAEVENALNAYSVFMETHTADSTDFGTHKPYDTEFRELSEKLKQFAIGYTGTDPVAKALEEKWNAIVEEFIIQTFIDQMNKPEEYWNNSSWSNKDQSEFTTLQDRLNYIINNPEKPLGNNTKPIADGKTRQSTLLEDIKDYLKQEFGVFFNDSDESFNNLYDYALNATIKVFISKYNDGEDISVRDLVNTFFAKIYEQGKKETEYNYESFERQISVKSLSWTSPVPEGSDEAYNTYIKAYDEYVKAGEANRAAQSALEEAKDAYTKASEALQTAKDEMDKADAQYESVETKQPFIDAYTKAKEAYDKANAAYIDAKNNADKATSAFEEADKKLTEALKDLKEFAFSSDARSAEIDALENAIAEYTFAVNSGSDLTTLTKNLTEAQDAFKTKILSKIESNNTEAAITKSIQDLLNKNNTAFYDSVKSALNKLIGTKMSDDDLEDLFNAAVTSTINALKQKNMLNGNLKLSDITKIFVTKLYEAGINQEQILNNKYSEFLSLLSWLQDSEAFKKGGWEFLNSNSLSDGLYQDLERIAGGTYMEYQTSSTWGEILEPLSDESSVEYQLFNNIKQYITNWLVEDPADDAKTKLRNYLLVNGVNVFDNLLKFVWGMTFGLSSDGKNKYNISIANGKCTVSSFAAGFLKCFIAQLKSSDDINALKTIMCDGPSGADSTSSTGAVASVFEKGSSLEGDECRHSAFDSYSKDDLIKLNIPEEIINKDSGYFEQLDDDTYKLKHSIARIYFSIEEFYTQGIQNYGNKGYESGAYKSDVDSLISNVISKLDASKYPSVANIMELWLDDHGNIKTQGINNLDCPYKELWNYIQNNLVKVLKNEYPLLYNHLRTYKYNDNSFSIDKGVENLIFNIWNNIKQNATNPNVRFIDAFKEELEKVLKCKSVSDLYNFTTRKKNYAIDSRDYWMYQLNKKLPGINQSDFDKFFVVTKTDEYGNKTYGLKRDKITGYYTYNNTLSPDFDEYVRKSKQGGEATSIDELSDAELFEYFMNFVMDPIKGRVPKALLDAYGFSDQEISRYFKSIDDNHGIWYRITTTIKTKTLGALKNYPDSLANYTNNLRDTFNEKIDSVLSFASNSIISKIDGNFNSANGGQYANFKAFISELRKAITASGLQELFGETDADNKKIEKLAVYLWNKTIGNSMFMSYETFKTSFKDTINDFFSYAGNITNFIANPDAKLEEDGVKLTEEQSAKSKETLKNKYKLTDADIDVLFHERPANSDQYFINDQLWIQKPTQSYSLLYMVNEANYIKDFTITETTTLEDFLKKISSSDTRFKKQFLSGPYEMTDEQIEQAFLLHADGTYSMRPEFEQYLQDNQKPLSIGAIIEALRKDPEAPNPVPEPKISNKLSDYGSILTQLSDEIKSSDFGFSTKHSDKVAKATLDNSGYFHCAYQTEQLTEVAKDLIAMLKNRGLIDMFGGELGVKKFILEAWNDAIVIYGDNASEFIDNGKFKNYLANTYFKDTQSIAKLTNKLVELGISISDELKDAGSFAIEKINSGEYNKLYELAEHTNVKLTIKKTANNTYEIKLTQYNDNYNKKGNRNETYTTTITITDSSAFEKFLEGNGHVFLADNWDTASDIPTVEEITKARLERALNTNMSIDEIVGNLQDSDFVEKDGKYYIAIVDEEYSNGTGYIVEELKKSFCDIIKNSIDSGIINQLYYGDDKGSDAFDALFDDAWNGITVSDYGIFYKNELGDYAFDYRNDDYKDIEQMYSDLLDRIESCLNVGHTITDEQDPYTPPKAN